MTVAIRAENTSTDLTMPSQDRSLNRLAEWAMAAEAAFRVADKIAHTSFVPKAYFGKPMEVTAAILAGDEVGLSPMASLRAFDNIQGIPAPKAITLRAIAQSFGHDVEIEEATETRAVVAGRRKGSDKWQRSIWDLDRARKLGLLKKDQWQNQPGAMLVARATSEASRWVASDAIMGMPYSAEELRDQDSGGEADIPSGKVTAAEILGTQAEPVQPAVKAEATPAEVGEAQATQPVSAPPAPVNPDPMPDNRSRKMFAQFRDAGFSGKDEQIAYIEVVIGRQIASRSELTAAEGEAIIAALDRTIAENSQAATQDGAE
jgi:hypothetical protein